MAGKRAAPGETLGTGVKTLRAGTVYPARIAHLANCLADAIGMMT